MTAPPALAPVATLDNGQWGYSERGLWTTATGGYNGTYRMTGPGTSSTYAQWRLPTTAGTYDVWVTWVPSASNMTNASYQVSDGGTVLGTVQQNQKLARFAGSYGGVYWADLGSFTINSGAVYVRVSANSSGSLDADGVLLVASVTSTPSVSLGGAKAVNAAPIGTIPAPSIVLGRSLRDSGIGESLGDLAAGHRRDPRAVAKPPHGLPPRKSRRPQLPKRKGRLQGLAADPGFHRE